MRLLICTQAVDENDPVLGFFCRWIEEFSKRYEHIEVICLKEGRHALPKNVCVHSLGKEKSVSRVKYLVRFFRYIWALRHSYDAVLVHMNEEYVLLGGLFWRSRGNQLGLWRNHKMGSWRTRLAARMSSAVFHTSPQAFVAYSPKAVLMPIGIDTSIFSPGESPEQDTILFLGRLDAIKRPELFLRAMQELAKSHSHVRADIYGDPTPGREAFARDLKEHFAALENVTFHGAVANDATPALYRSHAVYVNMTPAGSFDKTIGEAMASGAVVVAANAAIAPALGEMFCDTEDSRHLAEVIARAVDMQDAKRDAFVRRSREFVVEHHSLGKLADRLFAALAPRTRVCYVVNARMPSGKAYGIQVAKMCEALIETGVDLTLVIPTTERGSMREYYGLRVDVPTVRLWTPDVYARGKFAFVFAAVWFVVVSMLYLGAKRVGGALGTVYTIDMDTFSFVPYPLLGVPVVAEMHETKRSTLGKRFFFRRAKRIIATNTVIRDSLRSVFSLDDEKVLVEPNGVDLEHFHGMTKKDAREKLGLPQTARIALYVGRFYAWKGLDIVAEAAHLLPDVSWYLVGGDAEDFNHASGVSDVPKNLHFGGVQPLKEIPSWLAAADVLIVAGTKKNERSYRYTSPMKLYEYMAAERPIVAAKTPALSSIIPEHAAKWYEPDAAESLVRAVKEVEESSGEKMIVRARAEADLHSWKKRAERILVSYI